MELSKPAEMPFTPDSVIQMLECGIRPDNSPYSHKQIVEWCERFWWQYLDVQASKEINKLLPILMDIELQWDLFLTNSYTLEELRSQSFEHVYLPTTWFKEWLEQVKIQ